MLNNNCHNYGEKIILTLILGVLHSILEETITIDEAENLVFSPYVTTILRADGINESIIQLIERGCELEDIFSLIPDKFQDQVSFLIRDTVTLMKQCSDINQNPWRR